MLVIIQVSLECLLYIYNESSRSTFTSVHVCTCSTAVVNRRRYWAAVQDSFLSASLYFSKRGAY